MPETPPPPTSAEIEARAAILLTGMLVTYFQVPAQSLTDLADQFDAGLGQDPGHPAYARDHAINESASRYVSDLLRRTARTAQTNDN